MNTEKFFTIMSLLEKYANFQDNGEPFAYSHETAGTDTRYIVETNDLQTNFRNSAYWKDYRYFFHDKDPAVKKQSASIHAYLQGAIRDRSASQEKSDDSFLKYQQEVLKLMFGMYVFVDPTKSGSEHFSDQMPYYLLGPMIGKELKPTFNFRFYYNVDKKAGKAGKAEFENPPEKWLRFFLAFNEFSRDTLPFVSQDFVKLFNYSNYRVKRKLPLEQENNILYIPSGEMDHCILQWLVLYLKEVHHVPPGNDLLRTSISFNLKRMYPGIQDFYEKMRTGTTSFPTIGLKKNQTGTSKHPRRKWTAGSGSGVYCTRMIAPQNASSLASGGSMITCAAGLRQQYRGKLTPSGITWLWQILTLPIRHMITSAGRTRRSGINFRYWPPSIFQPLPAMVPGESFSGSC